MFLISLTAIILCAALGYMLFVPTAIQVHTLSSGVLTQDFTETGKLVSTRDMVVTCGIGEVVVGKVAVQEGQRVKKGDLLLTLEPGDLRDTLESQMEQQRQRRLSLEAQRKAAQSERTVAVEQARSSFESAKWEYELLFNEDWGIGENLRDTAVEDMLQARYTWFEVRDGDETTGMAGNRAHSMYRQTVDNVMVTRAKYSDEAKAYYTELTASAQKVLHALEGSAAAVEGFDAAIGELDAAIKLLEARLASTEITAPYDGVAHTVAVKDGQAVTLAAPLLSLASEQALEVELYLLAADAMDVRQGDSVLCKLENGVNFAGTVSFVAAAAQERVSTVGLTENRCLVRIRPDVLPQGAGNGFGVDVKFSVAKAQNVLSVPLSSVLGQDGEKGVYLFQGGKAAWAPITTGATASGSIEVTQGLSEGDQVILLPQEAAIKQGTRVAVTR